MNELIQPENPERPIQIMHPARAFAVHVNKVVERSLESQEMLKDHDMRYVLGVLLLAGFNDFVLVPQRALNYGLQVAEIRSDLSMGDSIHSLRFVTTRSVSNPDIITNVYGFAIHNDDPAITDIKSLMNLSSSDLITRLGNAYELINRLNMNPESQVDIESKIGKLLIRFGFNELFFPAFLRIFRNNMQVIPAHNFEDEAYRDVINNVPVKLGLIDFLGGSFIKHFRIGRRLLTAKQIANLSERTRDWDGNDTALVIHPARGGINCTLPEEVTGKPSVYVRESARAMMRSIKSRKLSKVCFGCAFRDRCDDFEAEMRQMTPEEFVLDAKDEVDKLLVNLNQYLTFFNQAWVF